MPNEKDYSSMSKTELIDHAETLGLSIPVSWTKERIVLKIKEKVDKPVNSGTSDFSGDPFFTDEHTDEVRIKKGNEDEERLSKPAAEIAKRIDNKDISYPFFFSFFIFVIISPLTYFISHHALESLNFVQDFPFSDCVYMMQDMTGRDLWGDYKTETYCNKIGKVIGKSGFYLYLTGMFTVLLIVAPFIIRKIRKNLKKSGFTIYDDVNRKEM